MVNFVQMIAKDFSSFKQLLIFSRCYRDLEIGGLSITHFLENFKSRRYSDKIQTVYVPRHYVSSLSFEFWYLICSHHRKFVKICNFQQIYNQDKEYLSSLFSFHFYYGLIFRFYCGRLPPPSPASGGFVTLDTSRRITAGTIYIQYFEIKLLLSLVSPRSRASRSFSIFWTKPAVSGAGAGSIGFKVTTVLNS